MLKSLSNPDLSQAALESMEVAPPPRQREGDLGAEPHDLSLAEQHVVVAGKHIQSALESIIGDSDDRTRILETELSPWRMICALEIHSTSGAEFVGSGWFAGPKTIVTAGHCVHSAEMGGWANRIVVSPGRNGSNTPFGSVNATKFRTVDPWAGDAAADYDIGCVQLDQPLGERTGWFGIRVLSDIELAQWKLNLSGYPLKPGRGEQQMFHSNRVHRLTPRRMFYQIDTSGGQSGAAVWIQDDIGDKKPYAVAVHAYGTETSSPDANSAPRIDGDVYDVIESWINE